MNMLFVFEIEVHVTKSTTFALSSTRIGASRLSDSAKALDDYSASGFSTRLDWISIRTESLSSFASCSSRRVKALDSMNTTQCYIPHSGTYRK